ncbi:glycerol-3-phosphate dehydrogenase [Sphingomonas sp. RS6]
MDLDLLIIGGGINGCAIAREAALNGWRVMLVEKDDLAAHTSSASSKLIHGGLRYLEQYEFRLVREALHERERLIAAAPHLIRPMAFVLPHAHAVRPWWMIRAGLWLYDLLAGRSSLPRSRSLRRGEHALAGPLHGRPRGFVYFDAWVDDARLTIANAVDAAANGARIATRTALTGATRTERGWTATLSDGGRIETRALVNAAGPWVRALLDRIGVATAAQVRLVKGSHIVVPRLYDGDHAYILQQPDRRIVFTIPYADRFTAIGTTDVPVDRPEDAVCSDAERDYLCDAANRYFRARIGRGDIVSDWSGVRALYDDGKAAAQAVTRDYHLDLDAAGAPLLSVFGGKITTARALAEEAVARLAPALGLAAEPMTRARVFPGGAIAGIDAFVEQCRTRWPFLGDARAARMAHAYGTRLAEMLDGVTDAPGLGEELGLGLNEIELHWLQGEEWARTAEDVLWRRSKLGLRADAGVAARIADWLARHPAA